MKFSMFIQPPRPNPRNVTGRPSALRIWLPLTLRAGELMVVATKQTPCLELALDGPGGQTRDDAVLRDQVQQNDRQAGKRQNRHQAWNVDTVFAEELHQA